MVTKRIPLEEKHVDSWEAFVDELKTLRPPRKPNGKPVASLLFRGQPDSQLWLDTTLERNKKEGMLYLDYYRLISKIKPEIEKFTRRQWPIPDVEKVEKSLQNDATKPSFWAHVNEYMAYLRHHGFPSPLLDWTRSRDVAAYFAFREFRELPEVSIYVLSEGFFKTEFNKEPSIKSYRKDIEALERHRRQQSEYTTCHVRDENNKRRFAKHEEASVYIDPDREEASVYIDPDRDESWDFTFKKFNIPSSERLKVLRLLDERDVNAFSLFGSEESLLETLALRELHFPE